MFFQLALIALYCFVVGHFGPQHSRRREQPFQRLAGPLCVSVDPGLDRRATDCRDDQSDRHLQLPMQLAPEEECRGRELTDAGGRTKDPLAGRFLPRLLGTFGLLLEQPDLRQIGGRLFLLESRATTRPKKWCGAWDLN
jgi:hypothetical protein